MKTDILASRMHTRRDLILMGLGAIAAPVFTACEVETIPRAVATRKTEPDRSDIILNERIDSLRKQAEYLKQALEGNVVIQPRVSLRLIVDGSVNRREGAEAIGPARTLGSQIIEVIDNPLVVVGKRTSLFRDEKGKMVNVIYDSWIVALTGKEPDFYGKGGFEFFAYSPETLTDDRNKKLILALENGDPITPSITFSSYSYNFAGRRMIVEQVRQNPDVSSAPVVVGRDLNGGVMEMSLPLARRIDKAVFNSSIQEEYGANAYVVMEFMRNLPTFTSGSK